MLTQTIKDLRGLRLGPMAACLEEWIDQPANMHRTSLECVEAMVAAQIQAAADKRAQRFMHEADLPTSICMADVRPSASRGLSVRTFSDLCSCEWIRRGHSLVITGPSGAGKTYVASALGREARLAELGVKYWRVPDLWAAFEEETDRAQRRKLSEQLIRVHLLILDDFAFQKATTSQGHELLKIIDGRHRHHRSTMVVSPHHIKDWDDDFDDATTADGLCSRLIHKTEFIDLKPPPRKTAA